MNRTLALVVTLAATLVACRSSDNPTPDVDAPVTGGVHIQDVQNIMMAA